MEFLAILLIWAVGIATVLFGLAIRQGPAPDMRKP